MRTLLIIVMMALAPLRAWAGDVMAIGMASEQAVVSAHAGSGLVAVAGMGPMHGTSDVGAHADCPGHGAAEVAAAQLPDAPQDDAASTHCPTCSFCQVCSSPGLAMTGPLTATPRFVHVLPLSVGIRFTSAERAAGFKPPIS